MEKILVICGDKEHLNELVSTINQRSAGVFNIKSLAKTSDLKGTLDHNIEDIRLMVLSLAEPADPPWDIQFLKRRFSNAPVIVELDIYTPERASHMTDCWGANDTFNKGGDVVKVIKKALKSKSRIAR